MLRIEILFDRETTKNMKAGTLQALRGEIERRLSSTHPEIWLRIEKSSQSSLTVSGTRNDREKENVMETLESIWQDENWLPTV
ncbi:DinI-like family protein [Salmonella enterica subsp. enterica serovar Newport]|nr:DinI-like family protein [Salmonella enterica subsp. enterica serovar Newport]EJW0496327.1 DinI-like family protein [Salmonella enterica subsp. enterica serovar Newport]ELA5318059.1 DinI-like family protein [Salmonella enterica subsp. enterica serovar Newport]